MTIKSKLRGTTSNFSSINWGQTQYSTGALVLKWGENSYPPPAPVLRAIRNSLVNLNRYPNSMAKLKAKLSWYTGFTPEQICLTNGSDKAFRLLGELFLDPGDEVITFNPSYPVISSIITLMGGNEKSLALTKDFLLPPLSRIKKAMTAKTKLIYVCNPNNPTGNFIAESQQIEELLQLPTVVVVDEAYFEFSGLSVAALINQYDNLVILRSFSKTFGLAGLRVGYVLASRPLAQVMTTIEETLEIFNIATPSLAGSLAALSNLSSYQKIWGNIARDKQRLQLELKKLGLTVYPSQTSFLLFDIRNLAMNATEFVQSMAKRNIILKDCSIYQGLDNYQVYTAIPQLKDLPRFIWAVKSLRKARTNI